MAQDPLNLSQFCNLTLHKANLDRTISENGKIHVKAPIECALIVGGLITLFWDVFSNMITLMTLDPKSTSNDASRQYDNASAQSSSSSVLRQRTIKLFLSCYNNQNQTPTLHPKQFPALNFPWPQIHPIIMMVSNHTLDFWNWCH